jgi:hypothetical protein
LHDSDLPLSSSDLILTSGMIGTRSLTGMCCGFVFGEDEGEEEGGEFVEPIVSSRDFGEKRAGSFGYFIVCDRASRGEVIEKIWVYEVGGE